MLGGATFVAARLKVTLLLLASCLLLTQPSGLQLLLVLAVLDALEVFVDLLLSIRLAADGAEARLDLHHDRVDVRPVLEDVALLQVEVGGEVLVLA